MGKPSANGKQNSTRTAQKTIIWSSQIHSNPFKSRCLMGTEQVSKEMAFSWWTRRLPSSITKRFRSFRTTAWAADSVPSTSKNGPLDLRGAGARVQWWLPPSINSELNVGCPKLGNGTEESKVDPPGYCGEGQKKLHELIEMKQTHLRMDWMDSALSFYWTLAFLHVHLHKYRKREGKWQVLKEHERTW